MKSLIPYQDVIAVMEAALANNGALYRVPNYGAAVGFRQRCYKYRKLRREAQKEELGQVPGFIPSIPEDILMVRILDERGENYSNRAPADKTQPVFVEIKPREFSLGQLTDLQGNPISPEPSPADEEGLDLE